MAWAPPRGGRGATCGCLRHHQLRVRVTVSTAKPGATRQRPMPHAEDNTLDLDTFGQGAHPAAQVCNQRCNSLLTQGAEMK